MYSLMKNPCVVPGFVPPFYDFLEHASANALKSALEKQTVPQPLLTEAIAKSVLKNEDADSEKLTSWCEFLYASGRGALWQDVLRLILTADFTDARWREKRKELDNYDRHGARHWLQRACFWKDPIALGLLLAKFNPSQDTPPRPIANVCSQFLREECVSERARGANSRPLWDGWWDVGQKAWDGVTQLRHFTEFLEVMDQTFKNDQRIASLSEQTVEGFAANLFRYTHHVPESRAWLQARARKGPWHSSMTQWILPVLEVGLGLERPNDVWASVGVWFGEEALPMLQMRVSNHAAIDLANSLKGVSLNIEHDFQPVAHTLHRAEKMTRMVKEFSVNNLLKGPETQTQVMEAWQLVVEFSARRERAAPGGEHLPALLGLLHEVEGLFQGSFVWTEVRKAKYERAKLLLCALENDALMRKTTDGLDVHRVSPAL